jgi:hypothetical protein
LVAVLAKPRYFFAIYIWGTTLYLLLVLYLGGLTHVAGGPYHSFFAVSLVLAGVGVASACFAAMQSTLTYLGSPPEYRSRLMGVLTLCIGSGLIGFFNVGWMAESYGVSAALLISGLEGLFAFLLLWLYGSDEGDASADAAG